MNIKILDSWLRDYIKTPAKPKEIAEMLSTTSVSVEKVEKHGDDFTYDIEITTNRPDLMSVLGLARETAAVLNQYGIEAKFIPLKLEKPQAPKIDLIKVVNNPRLVNRICAIVMEVKVKESPGYLKERLETSDIRSLNNLIDITNYVMRTIGHPAHVFDFDRLNTKNLTIREAEKGERVITLDSKEHILYGGEIVAVNDRNEIVDLLGIMGLKNSVVTENTKRILFFIDNNEKSHIRKASMSLGIRTDAAVINEKNLDPELASEALLYGIKLYEQLAEGKIISEIIDIYPNKQKAKEILVSEEKINKVIGVKIPLKQSSQILSGLGFENIILESKLKVRVPSFRASDIEIEEDIIEEIARIFGYSNIPSKIPPLSSQLVVNPFANTFYWEKRVKEALKYWGFTETYTYSFVSEDLLEGPIKEAVAIQNPLTEDFAYMRLTLVPSLLKVLSENKKTENIKIFELSKIYKRQENELPQEQSALSGVIKNEKTDFYEIKGLLEQLLNDLGIKNSVFKNSEKGGLGASVYIGKEYLGEIEVLDNRLIDFELNFEIILKHANLKKEYKPLSKFPPIVEDISVIVSDAIKTQDILEEIKKQSELISEVTLKDRFNDSRTFHIIYLHPQRNLTNDEISKIRQTITASLKSAFNASIK
ncbi:MAG: phenylalanine--tRNA ligase subunit beta [Patescibacteria group bacterium]|nr:phenylalanine--tRNA ligase subunit beta [Patescibacteria group bacterium]